MPNERIPAEPTLEELSGYLDHELDAAEQARVAEHLAGCPDCQERLDGLRQTAHAIRALPMETPTRSFTIPAQRRQSFRWAPVGWVGGLAATMLVIVVGATQLHFHGPGGAASTSTISGGLSRAPYGQVAPTTTGQTQALDSNAYAARPATNHTVVVDPRNSSRSLTVGTDATFYSPTGVISVNVTTRGLSANEASSVRLILARGTSQGGYSVQLLPPTNEATFPFNFDAAYSIPQMQLPAPVAGNYTLRVTIDTGNGSALVASLPLTITS